ncbi:hypothetical protein BDV23DRAFT_181574 [Aspergillus alliaceus]|uniref:Uncharacterized protein n=1 Tax=Petromyces alliaceus TaxID=209559 RepID=A0A5N7CE45_PETAA|nr:hypothetical protein BDV23DRAFT_181574 [Aspergillus alliaceus]
MPKGYRIPLEPNPSCGLIFLIGGRLSMHLGQDSEGKNKHSDPNFKWAIEVLHPKERLKISKTSDKFNIQDSYWQYILVLKALDRTKCLPLDDAVVDIEQAEAAMDDEDGIWEPPEGIGIQEALTSRRKNKKKNYKVGDELKTDIFESSK